MVIIVYAEKNYENTGIVLETVFSYGGNNPVVLVDNTGDMEFESKYKDFEGLTYVLMDEGYEPVGTVLNQVINGLDIDEDFLFLESCMGLCPETVSALQKSMENDEAAGVIAAMCNTLSNHQCLTGIKNYSQACEYSKENNALTNSIRDRWVINIGNSAVLFKKSVWDEAEGFDSELTDIENCFCDYCLRVILKKKKTIISSAAVAWDIRGISHLAFMKNENDLLEKKWGVHYINNLENYNLISKIDHPADALIKVLEIGCTCGTTLLAIKNMYPNSKIYGAEINPDAVRITAAFADKAVTNNIEEYNLDLGVDAFDYIILGDVLEHLRNPLGALKYVKTLLGEDAKIIISVPNLMHISVMKELLNGRFTYTEYGLLDKTHIHFFTCIELKEMLSEAGFVIETLDSVAKPLSAEDNALIDSLIGLGNGAERYMYETFQYVLRAKKKK